jgi:hypothetical protein
VSGPARLLLPASELAGQVVLVLGRGMARERVVWGFTDTEALGAWGRHPEGTATPVEAATLAALLADGPAMLVVNPAGPDGRVVPGSGSLEQDLADADLPPEEERRRLRAAAVDDSVRARSALERGDHHEALEACRAAISACNELGDLLHAATATGDLGSVLAAAGKTEAARAAAETAGMLLGALGETDLGVEMLIRAAELALDSGDPGTAARLARTATFGAAGPAAARLAGLWQALPTDADGQLRAPAGYDR